MLSCTALLPPARGIALALALGVLATHGTGAHAAAKLGTSTGFTNKPTVTVPKEAAPAPTDAFRFLTQATFGPRPGEAEVVQAQGYPAWISEQMARPWHTLAEPVRNEYRARRDAGNSEGPSRRQIISAFWRQALTADAQLRWRVAFALSQIFVVSSAGAVGFSDPIGTADYHDMLARHAFGNYRDLLHGVARHPAMGRYLSHLNNQQANPRTGRVPDENFAREVMQLFSIGLVQLNRDGSPRLGPDGQPLPTYDADDVAGMARVFTGWSWDCGGAAETQCFGHGFRRLADAEAGTRPMAAYAGQHSLEAKTFLGQTLPAQAVADPQASLDAALDVLFRHPNVGPFIGRQLIQRLVTSNPSPAYVDAVAAVFNNNGRGVRGDLGAVVRAVLLHREARSAGSSDGKVREPVLRLTALARAFETRSVSGQYLVYMFETAEDGLGQVPLSAPSVFNFYRPGYVAPGSRSAAAGLVAPELQIADETTVAGYVRFMRRAVESGFGAWGSNGRPDLQLDLRAAQALAGDPPALVEHIFARLLGDASYPALRAEIVDALEGIAVPALNSRGSNAANIESALLRRLRVALLLTVAAPEFIVQK